MRSRAFLVEELVKSAEWLPHWPRVLSVEQAAAYVGVSKSGLRTLQRQGFPKPFKLFEGRTHYLRDHIDMWIDLRAIALLPKPLDGWDEPESC